MTKAELIALMRNAWTGDAASGLSSPLTPAQTAMINAQLGAIADGILAGGDGGSSYSPTWRWDEFAATGSEFTLAHAPIPASLQVFRNGVLELGWTLAGTTLTLADPRTAGDADLRAHYQYVEIL